MAMDTIHVPIEIIDEIVDYLQDKRSLLNCALTSKSWASSCRRHIFRDLELDYWSPFERWCKSICATPNGPHIHTRTLKINDEEFGSTPFLQHFNLFSNLRSLTINPSFRGRVLETISLPDTFGHLTDTLRSLSLLGVCCSPQTLMSLVTLFPHLENLELDHISLSIDGPKLPSHALERRTLKGSLTVLDNVPHNYKQFYPLLAEHDLQYREMGVSGVDWLLDSPCNTCLVKCSEQLESLSIVWSPERLPDGVKYNIPTFKNLRKLLICSWDSTLPPLKFFLTVVASKQLAEIDICFQFHHFDESLVAIRGYEDTLCKLSEQLESPSPGSDKLILTLRGLRPLADPNKILPRFNKVGVLKVIKPSWP